MYDNIQFSNWTYQSCVMYKNSHIPDFLSEELGFCNTIVNGIPDPLACIPDFKSQDSRFHKQ